MKRNISLHIKLAALGVIVATVAAQAKPTIIPPAAGSGGFDTNTLLSIIAVVLLLPIILLSRTLIFTAKMAVDKAKEKAGTIAKVLLPIGLIFLASNGYAQEAAAATDAAAVAEKSAPFLTQTNLMILVILVEALVILFFGWYTLKLLKNITQAEAKTEVAEDGTVVTKQAVKENFWGDLWQKANKFKPMSEEAKLDTGHSYDGIRELDNVTPPWFTIAFIGSIIFGMIYMWRYHVTHSAPLQEEEFKIEMAQAEQEKEAFLKTQANSVDEKTVKMLDAAGIAAGKAIFTTTCAACHGANAASMPGGVGPNLTDNNWIHGGTINDIFKTIKYGWPEKGMQSWKDQFTPTQIAQLASFVKSVSGTNVKGKEPQGDLFKEEGTAASTDSTAATKPAADSTKAAK